MRASAFPNVFGQPKSVHRWLTTAGLLMATVLWACTPPPPPTPPPPSPVPTDAQDACPLSSTTFASWFASGSVTANGVVNPANSLDNLTPNCGFFEWSEHMFLWLNSPAPVSYGGRGGRIFTSPTFFDVSPMQSDGHRIFIKHQAGSLPSLNVRAAQVGGLGLPVIMDRFQNMFNIERAEPGLKPLVRNLSGQLIEIAHARRGPKGELILLDSASRVIHAMPALRSRLRIDSVTAIKEQLIARRFLIDKIPVFIALSGGLVEVEQGQSDGAVLEAQNGSLVYYETTVNDVFAYFDTGVKDGAFTPVPTEFPTTNSELAQVTDFASAHGKTFPDANALAVEVKTSWIKADGLPNLDTYITRTATIPTYDRTNPDEWVPNGQETVKLAMVAMHVVGSVSGHPEMVWATFTHVGTAPNAAFTYNSTTGAKTVPQNTSGTWQLSASGATSPFNVAHMDELSGTLNIDKISPHTISPSNTLRVEPWGMDGTAAASISTNTQVISMNRHVLSMLASGDIRKNYVMIGATWLIPGSLTQVGTSRLANTTMETYEQGGNCLGCHFGMTGRDPTVSHVFRDGILPLF